MNKRVLLACAALVFVCSSCGIFIGTAAVGSAAYAYETAGVEKAYVGRPLVTTWELSQVFFEDMSIELTSLSKKNYIIEGTLKEGETEKAYEVRVTLKKLTEKTTEVELRVRQNGIPVHGKAEELFAQLKDRLS